MLKSVNLWKLGKLSYVEGLKVQKYFAEKHLKCANSSDVSNNVIVLLEHNPVYTIGIRDKSYNENDEERLRNLGAEFHKTNRGGLITFHGPGQLVAYPIINLKHFKLSMKCYVAALERTIINLCEIFKLEAYTCEHTGVWINDRKICAIGVHGSRYITTHGLALNYSLDVLKWFEHIVPCGIEGKGVTSLSKELSRNIELAEVSKKLTEKFEEAFKCSHVEMDESEVNKMVETLKLNNT